MSGGGIYLNRMKWVFIIVIQTLLVRANIEHTRRQRESIMYKKNIIPTGRTAKQNVKPNKKTTVIGYHHILKQNSSKSESIKIDQNRNETTFFASLKAYVITTRNSIDNTLQTSLIHSGFIPLHVAAVTPSHSFSSENDFVNYCFGDIVSNLGMHMSLGEIGLVGSHRKALQLVADDDTALDDDWALILEDDARFVHPPSNHNNITREVITSFIRQQRKPSYGFAYFGLCVPICQLLSPDGIFGSECLGMCTHAYAITKHRARTFFNEVYCRSTERKFKNKEIPCGEECSSKPCYTDAAFYRHFNSSQEVRFDNVKVGALFVGASFASPDDPSHKGLMYQCCRSRKVKRHGTSLKFLNSFNFQGGNPAAKCYRLSPTGRFGDLMFQYAALVGLCVKKHVAVRKCASLDTVPLGTKVRDLPIKLFIDTFNISFADCPASRVYYNEASSGLYDPKLFLQPFGAILSGNMLSWKYFHPHAQADLMRLFRFPLNVTRDVDQWIDSLRAKRKTTWVLQVRRLVCLHVQSRYKMQPHQHSALSADFYCKAIDLLLKRHGNNTISLAFFSGGGNWTERDR